MQRNIYLYIFVMAAVTYLIRVLPLTLIRRQIKNTFLRSFLYYVPYVTLAVMTFPALLSATGSPISAWA
ncbi:MAG: AzlD domain-containing protein, partial [Butyricicoccus sp.]|nr:AzlD domain-containing protein [Butyricicoccus sp.]